jgi:hypothetical protein
MVTARYQPVPIMITKDESRSTNLNNSLKLRLSKDLSRKKIAAQYLHPG